MFGRLRSSQTRETLRFANSFSDDNDLLAEGDEFELCTLFVPDLIQLLRFSPSASGRGRRGTNLLLVTKLSTAIKECRFSSVRPIV
jgi:hypothetical protein